MDGRQQRATNVDKYACPMTLLEIHRAAQNATFDFELENAEILGHQSLLFD